MSLAETSTGVALWRRVADSIEQSIADGTYPRDSKLPGATEIAELHRVNRHTVRRALAALAERGLVRAERGSGTYVEAPRIAYPLRSRTRFSEIVSAGGHEAHGKLLHASIEDAPRDLAKHLGLKTGAPLLRIDALRTADRMPICVGSTWVDAERFPDGAKLYEKLQSITKVLEHYGIRDYRREWTNITAHCRGCRRRASRSRAGPPSPGRGKARYGNQRQAVDRIALAFRRGARSVCHRELVIRISAGLPLPGQ